MRSSKIEAEGVGSLGVSYKESEPTGVQIWRTPAVLLAQRCCNLGEVVLVAERYEGNRHSVLIVLKADPDDVLDAVYDAEAETIKELHNMPFDLRVLVPTDTWSPEGIRQSYLIRYQADEH